MPRASLMTLVLRELAAEKGGEAEGYAHTGPRRSSTLNFEMKHLRYLVQI